LSQDLDCSVVWIAYERRYSKSFATESEEIIFGRCVII